MFEKCKFNPTFNISRWDVSNVTIMWAMFSYCNFNPTFDISGWDVSNVEDME